MPRATENDVALAVLRIAASRPDGICTFNRARSEVPKLVKFAPDDLAQSATRPNEPMWHQLIRNIKSHYQELGNFINNGFLEHISRRGYKATPSGRAHLEKNGF